MHILRATRKESGSLLADYTAAFVVLFLVLIWPFVDYVTVGLRYMIFRDIVHQAVQTASKCTTFTAGSSGKAVMDRVPAVIASERAKHSGVNNISTMIRIKETNLDSQQTTNGQMGQPWPTTPDALANVYTIEVICDADLEPLLPYVNGPFGNPIPGVTGPMRIRIASQLMSETPSGLNQ